MRETNRIPILLDTDIGSDIDDAVALAYLLREPRCDLLGITVVTGDVQKRAALAEIVCAAAGRSDIPIHCGRREVLVDGPGQPLAPQYDAVSHRPHRLERPENTAVEFLRNTIRSRPHEIVLLSIGPFSNLALLFALDPDIPLLVREIVSMAGVFFQPGSTEFNARCDPTATSMVYGSARKSHLTVGLDVTLRCRMVAQDVRARFQAEPLKTVEAMAERWFETADQITFHDPLTAALIFHPELCAYRSGTVLSKDGKTRLKQGAGPDRVPHGVDPDLFFRTYFGVFGSP